MNSSRAFAYARFSTDNQEDGTSIENQLIAIRRYAKENGFTIVREFTDPSVSGTIAMENRPQGSKMLNAIKTGECDAVVFYESSRANRGLTNSILFRNTLNQIGVSVHYSNLGEIKGMLEMFANFLDWKAQEEVADTRDRTMKGKRNQVLLNKKMVFFSRTTFGYVKVGSKKEGYLEINPDQAKWIKDIFEFYVYKSVTLQGIADYLNGYDVSTATGIIPSERPKGHAWEANSIYKILCNPMYKGIYSYGKTTTKVKINDVQKRWERTTNNNPEEWITLEFPELQIVSPELWEHAQEKMTKNKQSSFWTARNKGKFLLTGFMKCPHCGYSIGGWTSKEKSTVQGIIERFKYGCRNRNCVAYTKSIVQHVVDQKVWEWLKEQIKNEDLLEAGIDRMFLVKKEKVSTSVNRKEELEKLIKDSGKQVTSLVNMIARISDQDEGGEATKALEEKLLMVSKQKSQAEKDLRELISIITENAASEEDKAKVFAVAKEIGKKMRKGEQSPTPAKRKLLEMLNLKIEFDLVGKRQLKVSWGFGDFNTVQFDNNAETNNNNGSIEDGTYKQDACAV